MNSEPEPPPEFSRAFSRRDDVELATTVNCPSPPEPPRIPATHHRLRPTSTGTAVPGHHPFAAEKLPPHHRLSAIAAVDFPVGSCHPPPSPPVTIAGDSPTPPSRPETNFCMPECMRGYGQLVDQQDHSLVWSINRLRAVTPSTLSRKCLFSPLVGSECATR
uniref:Uncharacterized protein n=1 Tax=Brassica campestris TaxID=3711 RepID=M4FD18_BRACM